MLCDSFGARYELARFDLQVKEPLGESPNKKSIPRMLRDSFGARTQDPNIKSVVLYQLS